MTWRRSTLARAKSSQTIATRAGVSVRAARSASSAPDSDGNIDELSTAHSPVGFLCGDEHPDRKPLATMPLAEHLGGAMSTPDSGLRSNPVKLGAMKSIAITGRQARRLWIAAQKLDAESPFGAGPAAVKA